MKEKILSFFSYFHWYDIILSSAFLLLAMCFIFLSFIAFRKKFISIPLFLLGFIMMLALPFIIRYCMEERFYKIEIERAYDGVYNYSDVYQYIATVTNVGKRNISGCVVSHQILYDVSKESGINKYKYMLLNYVKPKRTYNKDIPMDLKVGQSIEISEVMEDYPYRGEPYITRVECYGKSKYADDIKRLEGFYKTKATAQDNEKKVDIQNQIDIESKDKETQESDKNTESIITSQDSNQNVNENVQNQDSALQQDTQPQAIDTNNSNESIQTPKQDTQTVAPQTDENPQDSNIPIPPQEAIQSPNNQLPDNWRELRDNFQIPLLKEAPR